MLKLAQRQQREIAFDILRIIAVCSVMFLHVATARWKRADITSADWVVLTMYSGVVRYCVPVFVMISGAFLLDPQKEVSMNQLFRRYIKRIGITFFFWSIMYAIIVTGLQVQDGKLARSEVATYLVQQICVGRYHLWFLLMILCLYLSVPILRKITESKQLCRYFIGLWVIFALMLPTLSNIPGVGEIYEQISKKANMKLVMGYTGYYILGYYLRVNSLKKSVKYWIYLGGMVSVIITFVGTYSIGKETGEVSQCFFNCILPTTALMSAAIFLFVRDVADEWTFTQKQQNWINQLSKYSFGMYLVHDFFNILFSRTGFSEIPIPSILSVPLITACVFIGSYIMVALIKKIPRVGQVVL